MAMECGCQCSFCNTTSLDLHHEIESLKASLSQSRDTVKKLKADLKSSQDQNNSAKSRKDIDLREFKERYDRLEESHRKLERLNHDLEDKILCLVQENDKEQQATMSIHEDLHKKLKASEERIQSIVQEKDALAARCKVVLDLLRTLQTGGGNSNNSLISKEIFRLRQVIQHHEDEHPIDTTSSYDVTAQQASSFMPVSTFPPCAIMFDHSPKAPRKHLATSNLPRNFSDSRLAKMSSYPTDLKLCANCKNVCWTRDVHTQTETKPPLNTLDFPTSLKSNRIFDI